MIHKVMSEMGRTPKLESVPQFRQAAAASAKVRAKKAKKARGA